MPNNAAYNALRHYVSGAVARGEKRPIVAVEAPGQIFAFITGTAVRWPSEDSDDYEESHGWISASDWPSKDIELHESRNDVQPVINLPEDDEDLADQVRELIGTRGYAVDHDNGDGTFYLMDGFQPHDSDWHYSFAIHFSRKGGASENWQETGWHPETDGKIDLSESE